MKRAYVPVTLKADSLATVEQANTIISAYQRDGLNLTLRQLYYQFVSKNLIRNNEREYDRLGRILSDARLQGLTDWSAIVDRGRHPSLHHTDDDPASTIDSFGQHWTVDEWRDQDTRVEVWIEKEALIGVLDQVCPGLDVSYFACKGYVSQSAMWSAAQRHLRYNRRNQNTVVLYLGDHDPSGLDMSRDVQDRLLTFRTNTEVRRIALNMDQIEELNPPPNPTKATDSRAHAYVQEYGYECWELDALEPSAITSLVEEKVLEYRDESLYAAAQQREQDESRVFRQIAARWDDVVEFVADEEVD